MNYSNMTTEKLESLLTTLEEKINGYVGMSFMSPRSDLVSYEIDSFDSDSILINANHFFDGLIRDYTVNILGGVYDDVEYNHYNGDGDCVDGGHMSFDRLPKIIRNAVLEIYALYKEIEKINSILDARAEEEEEEDSEEDAEEDAGVNTMKIEKFNKYDHTAKDNKYCVVLSNFEEFKQFSKGGNNAEIIKFIETHRKDSGLWLWGSFPVVFTFVKGEKEAREFVKRAIDEVNDIVYTTYQLYAKENNYKGVYEVLSGEADGYAKISYSDQGYLIDSIEV